MIKTNFQELYGKMEKVLNPWKARSMTWLGKIVIVNTLLASQAVYKF